jgi:uncharacterized protein with HEPN domain
VKPGDIGAVKEMLAKVEQAMNRMPRMTRESFLRREDLRLEVTKLVQELADAALRVSLEFQADHQEILWAGVKGLRKRVMREDGLPDFELVWEFVTVHYPPFAEALRLMLSGEFARQN